MNQLDKDTVKCSVCKATRSDAWYVNEKSDIKCLCNFCCDSSGISDPKGWVGLCVHCLKKEAAYPIYKSGLKQFTCCNCYLAHRKQVKKARNAITNQKKKAEQKPGKKHENNFVDFKNRKRESSSKSLSK